MPSLNHAVSPKNSPALGMVWTLNGYFRVNPIRVKMEEKTEVTGIPVIRSVLAQIPIRAARASATQITPSLFSVKFSVLSRHPPAILHLCCHNPRFPRTPMPNTALENSSAVGFMVQERRNAPVAYPKAPASPFRERISSSIISTWNNRVMISVFAVMDILVIAGTALKNTVRYPAIFRLIMWLAVLYTPYRVRISSHQLNEIWKLKDGSTDNGSVKVSNPFE